MNEAIRETFETLYKVNEAIREMFEPLYKANEAIKQMFEPVAARDKMKWGATIFTPS